MRRIRAILHLMRSTTSPTLIFSPLHSIIWCETTLYPFDPHLTFLVFCGMVLLGEPQGRWTNGLDAFLGFSLSNSSVTTYSSTTFILTCSNNWNTLAKVGCGGESNMASHTQSLSSLFKSHIKIELLGLTLCLVSPWSTYTIVHRLFINFHEAYTKIPKKFSIF